MRYSVIIPVYNRPDEVDELLQSLTRQSFKDFEVIIVEDGSSVPCKNVADRYQDILNIRYYSKPNSGPGQTRNYGAERSRGEYLIILDSDCILPEDYFQEVEKELQETPADAFGGPDRAHASFTDVQKAINYSMTSFFTTGGIRGGKKKMDKFYPRSFNMGVRREVYEALGGFSRMRFGEDIDFSIRIFKGGYRCRLFPGAWVYHKRRTDLKKFFKQEILQASAQFRHCPHQPLQETSRLLENRASAARHIHSGSSGATGRRTFLPIQPPTGCAICTARLHRLRHSKQEPAHRPLFHCRILHPAHRIWNRILESLVEPLHTRQR